MTAGWERSGVGQSSGGTPETNGGATGPNVRPGKFLRWDPYAKWRTQSCSRRANRAAESGPPAWPADVPSSGGEPGRFELKRGHRNAGPTASTHERDPIRVADSMVGLANQAQHPSQRGKPCASNGGGGYPRPCDLILSWRHCLADATPQFVAQCLACHPAISTPARVRSAQTTNPTGRHARCGHHGR
jgi:hypothetical protein